MDDKTVNNSVVDVAIMYLSIYKIGGWKNLQPSNETLLEFQTEIHSLRHNSWKDIL